MLVSRIYYIYFIFRSTDFSTRDGQASNYEWHDLPPLLNIKDAIIRKQVCSGINYVLPVDKSKNSVDNVYRTNLRVVFQEPYITESKRFDEMKLRASTSHHFDTNHPQSPYKISRELTDYTKYNVNVESSQVRTKYNKTAPSTGITGRETKPDSYHLQRRSDLFLPNKTNIPEEASELKREAQKILTSVDAMNSRPLSVSSSHRRYSGVSTSGKVLSEIKGLSRHASLYDMESADLAAIKRGIQKRVLTSSYQECSEASKRTITRLPKELKTPYMGDEKSQEVWQWLNTNDNSSDFNTFMTICS